MWGTHEKLKRYWKIVKKIESFENEYKSLTDQELKEQTSRLQSMFKQGKSIDALLPRAFATVREADRRVLGMFPFPVQLLGGIVLHEGNLAEMKTGEGKTLTETLPVYLNALMHGGVHIVTVNEYLAARDKEDMGRVFEWLGLTVGLNTGSLSLQEKRAAYKADVMYTTNSELAFDFLRDNMADSLEKQIQSTLSYAIIDEVDSILIDEARTPLIISGQGEDYSFLCKKADKFVKSLKKSDFKIDSETKTICLTETGVRKANQYWGACNLYDPLHTAEAHFTAEALKANYTMHRDIDYVLLDNEVQIVDQFTGRAMPGRRFSDGLHQALEAKEHTKINPVNPVDASITYQNFFRQYHKLAGMTGTAKSESREFFETYQMRTISVPTNRKSIRKDLPDVIFADKKSKNNAIVAKIKHLNKLGRPVLIGTTSVEDSEELYDLLKKAKIVSQVLNAKNNAIEAQIIAKAGQVGAVTIATNMAGRGTDIKLTPESRKLGGLFVLGTDHHTSSRVDDQLKGRSGRQGDPGNTQFIISLDDELFKRYASIDLAELQKKMSYKYGTNPITDSNVRKLIAKTQRKVEGNDYDQRRQTLFYDDIMRLERAQIYADRQKVLASKDLTEEIKKLIVRSINSEYKAIKELNNKQTQNNELGRFARNTLSLKTKITKEAAISTDVKDLKREAIQTLRAKLAKLDSDELLELERFVILRNIDKAWRENLTNMEQIRRSIAWRSYGQRNPLIEYQATAKNLYKGMCNSIAENIVKDILGLEIKSGGDGN